MTFDGSIAAEKTRTHRIAWFDWVSSSALILCWLGLNRITVNWFFHLPQHLSRFNLILFLCVGLMLLREGIYQSRNALSPPELKFQRWPLVLMLGSAIASIVLRWHLDLESMSGAFFLLGSYGLAGLFLKPKLWRQGLPLMGAIALVILIALAPLSRSLIAEVVEWMLKPFHLYSLSSENILVLDTGIAFIDLPCSGRKSLWTGSLFLIAATVLERRQMGWRWFTLFFTNIGLLLTANILRILTLVVLTYGVGQGAIAQLIHTPFGLLSFVTICIVSWGLLRLIPQRQTQDRGLAYSIPDISPSHRGRNLAVILSCLVGLALIPTPAQVLPSPDIFNTLSWKGAMRTQNISLTSAEQQFFATYPGVVTQKKSFEIEGLTGSMILVMSPTWQAHHSPELCLTGNGFRVNHMEKRTLTPEVTGRWLTLNEGQQNAAYWFQSSQRTTDHYLDRLWGEMTRQESQWTMASILFDQSVESQSVQPMLDDVHDAIATAMI